METMKPLESFFHPLKDVPVSQRPEKLNNPFDYTPHPLVERIVNELRAEVRKDRKLKMALNNGKMMGVMVVDHPTLGVGYLAAFSGTLLEQCTLPGFVPPVYDTSTPTGVLKQADVEIKELNKQIAPLSLDLMAMEGDLDSFIDYVKGLVEQKKAENARRKAARDLRRQQPLTPEENEALLNESRHDKAELKRMRDDYKHTEALRNQPITKIKAKIERLEKRRREISEKAQLQLFDLYRVHNALGEERSVAEVFSESVGKLPPGGTGDCCAPRLLETAYRYGLRPWYIAEFWWGQSPNDSLREDGFFYPACRSKCRPLLGFMLQGLEVEENTIEQGDPSLKIFELYDDKRLTIVVKPSGLLSVPGTLQQESALDQFIKEHPEASGPMVVHRLDQETSGLMIFAKNKRTHGALQYQLEHHLVVKRYMAIVEGSPAKDEGFIDLPLRPDVDDRPRQMVDHQHGKKSTTQFMVVDRMGDRTRVLFAPITGRTHQIRVHAAHPDGLGCPIVGDRLYGHAGGRMCLQAISLTFEHPVTGITMTFNAPPEF